MRKLFGATLLILMSSLAMAAQRKMKLVVDTDPGCDDAQALGLLLSLADVVAITTVDGNVKASVGAENSCRILDYLHLYGIPVYKGAHCSMSNCQKEIDPTDYQGADGLNDVSDIIPNNVGKEPDDHLHAVDAITQLPSDYQPQKLTLVAIGPLTNLAYAVKNTPNLPSRYESLYIMGGSTTAGNMGDWGPYAEYNFWSDTEAAHNTLQAFIKSSTQVNIVPWETCKKSAIPFDEFNGIFEDAKDNHISKMLKETGTPPWLNEYEEYHYADQLVAMIITYPESVKKAECYRTAKVNYNGNYKNNEKYGQLTHDDDPQVCEKDANGIIKHRGVVVYRELDQKKIAEGFKKIMNDDRIFGEKEKDTCPDGYTSLNQAECEKFAEEKPYIYKFKYSRSLQNVVPGCSFDYRSGIREITYNTNKSAKSDFSKWTLVCKKG